MAMLNNQGVFKFILTTVSIDCLEGMRVPNYQSPSFQNQKSSHFRESCSGRGAHCFGEIGLHQLQTKNHAGYLAEHSRRTWLAMNGSKASS